MNAVSLGALLLVGGLLCGLPLAFFLLRALQRRFRLFTRGTIAFMTFVLVVFGAIDAIAHLNDVRNAERRLKAEAESRMVLATALAVLDPTREAPAGVDAEALDLLEELRRTLARDVAPPDDVPFAAPPEVVRVEVRPAQGLGARRLDGHFSRNWEVDGWLSDGRRMLRFRGLVAAFRDRDGAHRVIDVRGELTEAGDVRQRALHDGASWQNPGWAYDWTSRAFIERRDPPRSR